MENRIIFACAGCGSPKVTREAWATWDPGEQRWALGELFDHAFCHQCHRRVTVEPRPLEG